MVAKINISGLRFGKLIAINQNGFDQNPSRKHIRWDCLCDCGSMTNVRLNSLRTGATKSCGCSKKQSKNKTHGMTGTPEYMSWAHMKARCYNSKSSDYANYGARGIEVCGRWINSFENFYSDMGRIPKGMRSLDRIDVNGNYSPENCQWANDKMQSRNRRNNRIIEFDGKSQCLSDWASYLGINASSLIERLKKWPLEKALSTFKENQN